MHRGCLWSNVAFLTWKHLRHITLHRPTDPLSVLFSLQCVRAHATAAAGEARLGERRWSSGESHVDSCLGRGRRPVDHREETRGRRDVSGLVYSLNYLSTIVLFGVCRTTNSTESGLSCPAQRLSSIFQDLWAFRLMTFVTGSVFLRGAYACQ